MLQYIVEHIRLAVGAFALAAAIAGYYGVPRWWAAVVAGVVALLSLGLIIAEHLRTRGPSMHEAKIIPTEYHALQASLAVNYYFRGAEVLRPEKYWEVVQRNPGVLVSIMDPDNRMVGFFDAFPLYNDPARRFLSGQSTELDLLTKDTVCGPEDEDTSNYIYIGTIFAFEKDHPKRKGAVPKWLAAYGPAPCAPRDGVAPTILLHSMISPLLKFLDDRYPSNKDRIYFALGSTHHGDEWLNDCKFERETIRKFGEKDTVVYKLRSSGIKEARRLAKKLKHPRGYASIPIRCCWRPSLGRKIADATKF